MAQLKSNRADGTCDEAFTAVRDAFLRNFAEHGDLGASVAVFIDGKVAVDLYGGWADAGRRRQWQRDTIVNVWSTTKGITALAIHMLVDRGLIDVDQPVARYWPEFAGGGKKDLLVRWLLTHQAGLPAVDGPLPDGAALDWELMTTALARQEPYWKPGTKLGYHAVTFGWLLGELVRRVDGRSLTRFVAEEISGPTGLDLTIGCLPEHFERCAEVRYPEGLTGTRPPGNPVFDDPESLWWRSTQLLIRPPVNAPLNSYEWRTAEFGAMNGTTNARALASLYGLLACGGSADGFSLIREATLAKATAPAVEAYDNIIAMNPNIIRRGLGYLLGDGGSGDGRSETSFGHTGAGGSIAFADPARRLGFAYVMNQMGRGEPGTLDPRPAGLIRALYDSLD